MKRNRNIDFLRALAIIIIVVYHIYVLSGNPFSDHARIDTLLSFGGELGVTMFFMLSGYGIYTSLSRKDKSGMLPTWGSFMKSRCIRIMPQYYLCIVILIMLQSFVYVSAEGWPTVLAYFCFGQNLFVSTHGAVNGALWALATIFQFYLIAPFLYRLVRKSPVIGAVIAVAITVASKFIIYNFALRDADGSWYFVYGRQLVSALDNFVLGMVAANVSEKMLEKRDGRGSIPAVFGSILLILVTAAVSYFLSKSGIYGNSLPGYTGHTVLAAVLMVLMIFFAAAPQNGLKILNVFDWIAKYQYGVYLWHMPMIMVLGSGAPALVMLRDNNFVIYIIVMLCMALVFGGLYSKALDRAGKK